MAAITRLSVDGYGARRAGSFAGKPSAATRNILTRLSLDGYGARRAGSFAGKTVDGSVPSVLKKNRGFLTNVGRLLRAS